MAAAGPFDAAPPNAPLDRRRIRMSATDAPLPLKDLQELAPVARELVERELERRLPDQHTSIRFYREWSGGWRVRVEIGRPARGKLDFVLFEIAPDAIVAMPHPIPDAWRDASGVEASDGSRWFWNDEGFPERVPPAS